MVVLVVQGLRCRDYRIYRGLGCNLPGLGHYGIRSVDKGHRVS